MVQILDTIAHRGSAGVLLQAPDHPIVVDRSAPVLVTLSSSSFRGEEEHEIGFRSTMRTLAPGRTIREVWETAGLDASMLAAVSDVLDDPAIAPSTRSAVAHRDPGGLPAGRLPAAPFIALCRDGDNTALLRQQRLTAVLHHDLRADLRQACQLVLQAHQALPGRTHSTPSQVRVITPFHQPAPLWSARTAASGI